MEEVLRAASIPIIGLLIVVIAIRRTEHGVDRRRRAAARSHHPRLWFTVTGLILAAVVAIWIEGRFEWPVLGSWLVAVNLVAATFYGWDKLAASLSVFRVPERTLHLLALAGGSIGAFLAQQTFHHKTRKAGFQLKYWSIVAVQGAVLVVYARSRSMAG